MEIVDEKTGVTSLTIEAQLKKVRHLKRPEMPDIFSTYEEVQRREEEKRTKYKDLTKEEADTMVCDGAILKCSHGYYYGLNDGQQGIYRRENPSAQDIANNLTMITLRVPDYMAGLYLMGKDAAATNYCVHSDNFEINPYLNCKEGGKCTLKQMANEWINVSSSVIVEGFSALTKDSILTCKKCSEARITIKDNGQDPEIKKAGTEKWLVEHGISPSFRTGLRRGLRFAQLFGGGAEFIGGLCLIFTGGGTFAGIVATVDGIRNMSDALRDGVVEETGNDPYVNGLSIIGIPKKDAEVAVWMYDTTFFIIDGYNIAKGIVKLPKSISNIKKISDLNLEEETKYMFFEDNRQKLLNRNAEKLEVTNSALKDRKQKLNGLTKLKAKTNQKNVINSLEQRKTSLINERTNLINNSYTPTYRNIISVEDIGDFTNNVKTATERGLDALQSAKSISDLRVKYAKQRYGTLVRLVE